MKTCWIISAALTVLLAALPAQAQVYKWKDEKGNTVISDTPQPNSGKPVSRPEAETPPPPNASQSAPPSLADQELESKKRKQEQEEAQKQAAQQQKMAADKQENCNRARARLAALESGQRIRQPQADGTGVYIDDQQRAQEIARTREIAQSSCQ